MKLHVTECRSCGAPIIWAETKRGQSMPVEAEPTADGNLAGVVEGGRLKVRVFDGADLFTRDATRYVSHFATCPQAKDWRTKS